MSLAINKEQFPRTFDALELVSHDSGGQAGWAWYHVPRKWADRLAQVEAELLVLRPDELQEFCIGELSSRDFIKERRQLKLADQFLEDFFEEDWERG